MIVVEKNYIVQTLILKPVRVSLNVGEDAEKTSFRHVLAQLVRTKGSLQSCLGPWGTATPLGQTTHITALDVFLYVVCLSGVCVMELKVCAVLSEQGTRASSETSGTESKVHRSTWIRKNTSFYVITNVWSPCMSSSELNNTKTHSLLKRLLDFWTLWDGG